jgi:hypothetical protein
LSVLVLLGGFRLASAADRYNFTLSISGKTTNEIGTLINLRFNRTLILRGVAEENEVPPSSLTMIYERTTGKVLVVDRASGSELEEVVTFATDVSVTSSNGALSQVYFQISNTEASNFKGSGVGTAKITKDTQGGERSFKFNGKLFIAIEEEEFEPSQVYTGTFTTSSPFVPTNPM